MYFITCFQKLALADDGFPDLGAERTMGYYSQYKTAEEDLNRNNCDMYEYLYNYAVIEHIPEGIYQTITSRTFFKFDKEKRGYFPRKEPDFFKNFANIAFG